MLHWQEPKDRRKAIPTRGWALYYLLLLTHCMLNTHVSITNQLPNSLRTKKKKEKNPEPHVREQLKANCFAEWLETQIADKMP